MAHIRLEMDIFDLQIAIDGVQNGSATARNKGQLWLSQHRRLYNTEKGAAGSLQRRTSAGTGQ